MTISDDFLNLLRCPESKQTLHLADDALLSALNKRIAEGALKTRGGDALTRPLDAGLVREDGALLYPIEQGIPVMLIEEAIELDAKQAS